MKGTNSHQNQKQPKTLEEALEEAKEEAKVSKVSMETSKMYESYLHKVGAALTRITEEAPQAAEEYTRLVGNLQKHGECNRDKNALQKCRDEYNFRDGLMEGINKYLYFIFVSTPEKIKEFTEALKFLAEEQTIDPLYKLYQEVKKLKIEKNKNNLISQEDLDQRLYKELYEFVASRIFQYLENPEGRKEQFMKYLGYTPLEDADIAACRLYGGCKTEKQNT